MSDLSYQLRNKIRGKNAYPSDDHIVHAGFSPQKP
jgi:hypothetical protein